jgi:hypothetical protein
MPWTWRFYKCNPVQRLRKNNPFRFPAACCMDAGCLSLGIAVSQCEATSFAGGPKCEREDSKALSAARAPTNLCRPGHKKICSRRDAETQSKNKYLFSASWRLCARNFFSSVDLKIVSGKQEIASYQCRRQFSLNLRVFLRAIAASRSPSNCYPLWCALYPVSPQ